MDRINQLSLEHRLKAGLLMQEQFDQYTEQWDHYIPFKTDNDNRSPFASGSGFSVKGAEFKAAGGLETVSDAPIQFALQQAFQSVERAENNRVGLDFLNLLRAHKDEVQFTEDRPDDFIPPEILAEGSIAMKEGGEQVIITLPDKLLARAPRKASLESALTASSTGVRDKRPPVGPIPPTRAQQRSSWMPRVEWRLNSSLTRRL